MSLYVRMEGIDKLGDFFVNVKENLVNRKTLDSMAEAAKRLVFERTAAARDVHGAPFKPYSKQYRKAREKRGLSGARVDLKSTGEMLGDISTGSNPDRGLSTVSFNDGKSAFKAISHHEGRARREFFGLDASGQEDIERMLEEHVSEVIKDAH
mgnify:FL=1